MRPGLAISSLAATLVYLGLAISGFGGIAAFFTHPPLVVLAVATLALWGAALFSQGNLSSGIREDRGNRWVLPVFGVIGFVAAFLPAYTDRLDVLTLDGEALRWIGVLLFVFGGALRLWPVFVLGERFSGLVAIQPGHRLVTTGLYRRIRHPSYLGLLLNSLGWGLAFRSGIGIVLTALLVPPLLARISAEEKLLHVHFGDAYESYRARTARLLPGLY